MWAHCNVDSNQCSVSAKAQQTEVQTILQQNIVAGSATANPVSQAAGNKKNVAPCLFRCAYSTFFRKEQPSVSRALPPVGWHRTVEQEAQKTTVEAWLNMVVLQKRENS